MKDKNKNRLLTNGVLRQIALAIIDIALFAFVNCCICFITMGGHIMATDYRNIVFQYLHFAITSIALIVIHNLLGLYRSVWTYAGTDELVRGFVASLCDAIILFVTDRIIYGLIFEMGNVLPYYAYILDFVLVFFAVIMPRIGYRIIRRFVKGIYSHSGDGNYKRTMIVGAGFMGNFIIDELRHSDYKTGKPIIVIDDNPNKKGHIINGVKVVGSCDELIELATEYKIEQIIICVPSASKERQKQIISIAMKTKADVKISPSMSEFLESGGEKKSVRKVDITDLLSRPEVTLDIDICRYLLRKTILVTGGGGSIGSEICMQVARYSPSTIVIFDIYENCAFELQNELNHKYKGAIDIKVRIGSVRDTDRLYEIFEEFHPDVVFHAAAHKHVPLMEDSPCEAVKNNVFGTLNVAKVAGEFKVPRMVILSTDKAVNPTNVMGCTKRITEIIIQYMNKQCPTTVYAAVRFGNVLGSHGSVIPIFKKQIDEGGPVCVTHPDITRYFMTIPEAAQLVCQAGGLAKGGEVFVLDMGEPVKIMDLAKNLIRLSGYTEDEIEIKITGLRPGEKLYEELAMESEMASREKTANEKIYVTHPVLIDNSKIENMLDDLKQINNDNVREILSYHIKTYHPKEIHPTIH